MNPPATPALVCHVLLVETDSGLVLVDTGYGLRDIENPSRRIGPIRHLLRPALRPDETAVRQVERLGFRRSDVRHIVVTHFDLDHIGGIADFPDAQVHVTAAEVRGAVRSPSVRERVRFRSAQWAHRPRLVEHSPDGERWRGFAAAKELEEISPGIVLVSLPGHTRGHACIAVEADEPLARRATSSDEPLARRATSSDEPLARRAENRDEPLARRTDGGAGRWLLHCGDAFYHQGSIDGSPVPRVLAVQESLVAHNRDQVRENHLRLQELYNRADPDLVLFCSHDPVSFAQAVAGT